MAVDTDQFAMGGDGTRILKADGTFGLGPGCTGGCDLGSIATAYASFAGGIEPYYANTGEVADTGQLCGGINSGWVAYIGPWNYVYSMQAGFDCSAYQYGYSGDLPMTGNVYSLGNGIYFYSSVNLPGTGIGQVPCTWRVIVQFWVCVGGVWQSLALYYHKGCGKTPAGTYTFHHVSATWGYTPASLTYPATITLS